MSDKKRSAARRSRVAKSGPVWHMSAEESTLAKMPKYNAHACGSGAHGDAKYNRARQKQAWRNELRREDPRNRGGLPFAAVPGPGTLELTIYGKRFEFPTILTQRNEVCQLL